MFPWPHLITFLKPCRYHGAEVQEFVAPKKKKIQSYNCYRQNFFPESWTSCMLFLTKLPKIRVLAIVRNKFTKSPLEIMIL